MVFKANLITLLKFPFSVLEDSLRQIKIILFSTFKGVLEGLKIFARPYYCIPYVLIHLILCTQQLPPLLLALWKGAMTWWLYTFMRPSVDLKKDRYALQYVILVPIFISIEFCLLYFSPDWITRIGSFLSIDWVSAAPWAFLIFSWLDKQLRVHDLLYAVKQMGILTYIYWPLICLVIVLHKFLLVVSLLITVSISWLTMIAINFFYHMPASTIEKVLEQYVPCGWIIIWWLISTLFLISLWVTLYTIAVHNYKKLREV
jgi:hypothetical protein